MQHVMFLVYRMCKHHILAVNLRDIFLMYFFCIRKVTGLTERKICAVGVAKILTEAPSMLTTYVNFW